MRGSDGKRRIVWVEHDRATGRDPRKETRIPRVPGNLDQQ